MEKRLRTNLALVSAVAALGLLAWCAPSREDASATVSPPVDAGWAVSRIQVRQRGETRFTLQRESGNWFMRAPVALPAEPFQVDTLLDLLRAPPVARYDLQEVDLTALELVDPELSVIVDDVPFVLGGSSAVGNHRYLQSGDHVYLVSEMLGYQLARPALDYASRKLLPATMRIRGIELPDGTQVTRDGVAWRSHINGATVSSDDLQQLVDAWQNANAMKVIPAASVPRDGEVRIMFENGEELRFGVERREDSLVLSRDKPAISYLLPVETADQLLRLAVSSNNE